MPKIVSVKLYQLFECSSKVGTIFVFYAYNVDSIVLELTILFPINWKYKRIKTNEAETKIKINPVFDAIFHFGITKLSILEKQN